MFKDLIIMWYVPVPHLNRVFKPIIIEFLFQNLLLNNVNFIRSDGFSPNNIRCVNNKLKIKAQWAYKICHVGRGWVGQGEYQGGPLDRERDEATGPEYFSTFCPAFPIYAVTNVSSFTILKPPWKIQFLYLEWLRLFNPEYVVDQETLVWAVGEGLKSINQPNYFK